MIKVRLYNMLAETEDGQTPFKMCVRESGVRMPESEKKKP